MPKADFFLALAKQFPEWVLWILTGEKKYYPEELGGLPYMLREPEPPAYGEENKVKELLQTVKQLSATLENLSKLVNEVPVLREELERVKKELDLVKQQKK